MKQATVVVKLTKDNSVPVKAVTPIELLLLVADHHIKAGGEKPEVLKETITEVKRTEDEELTRLRTKYQAAKVAVLKDVRQLPTEFDDAINKGMALVMPQQSASNPQAAVVGTAKL